ncbi:MAG: glycosyltransferase family 2 protein [Rhodobacteraceae bacterium]|nr:MAG: glycosyltransferase family 2 protein [Paracoccaceae bacterium]
MRNAPAFSIIIPVHDAITTLPETLASLQAQSCADWEALIIDDASTDGSAAWVAEAARHDSRLRLIHDPALQHPRGTAAARNIGLDQAQGRYIAFLDADDLWLPDKLQRQQAAFERGARIVFVSYERIDAAGRRLGVILARPRVDWKAALYGNPIGCLTGAFCRASFGQARMPQRNLHEDYAFWLSLLRQGETAIGLPEILARYRVRKNSRSANKLRAARAVWDILGEQDIGLGQQLAGFAGYASRAVLTRARP